MMKANLSWVWVMGLAACGSPAAVEVEDNIESSELTIAVTRVTDFSTTRTDVAAKIFRNASEFQAYFSTPAPASVNFGTSWVGYYNAGAAAAYQFARIASLDFTSNKAKFYTRLDNPGYNCTVKDVRYTLVKFAKRSTTPTNIANVTLVSQSGVNPYYCTCADVDYMACAADRICTLAEFTNRAQCTRTWPVCIDGGDYCSAYPGTHCEDFGNYACQTDPNCFPPSFTACMPN